MNKKRLWILVLATLVTSCSIVPDAGDSKIDYRDSSLTNPLEMPPNLDNNNIKPAYKVPGQPVSAKEYLQRQENYSTDKLIAPNELNGMVLHTDGADKWLQVNLPIDRVWELTASFWQSVGLSLVENDSLAGVMQTNWSENKVKVNKSPVKKMLSKVLGGDLLETGFRDRYKSIIRDVDGSVKVIIQHQSLEEVYTKKGAVLSAENEVAWQAGKRNPELEIELLRKLMIFINKNQQE